MFDNFTNFELKNIMSVVFQYQTEVNLTSRKRLKDFITSIFRSEKIPFDSLTIIFCDDEFLLGLNRQFLQHDYYTDIISFTLSEPFTPVAGELYISIDRVKDNASQLKVSFKNELHRVMFHGALHLCGYSDKNSQDISIMRAKENFYLSKYFDVPRITVSEGNKI